MQDVSAAALERFGRHVIVALAGLAISPGLALGMALGGVLMGTIAYGGQKFFEWQLGQPSAQR